MSGDVISLTGDGTPFIEFTRVNFGEFPSISYHALNERRAAVMGDYYRERWNESAVFDPLIAIHNAVMDLAKQTFEVPPVMDRIAFDSWMRVSFGCAVGASALFATYVARSKQLRQTPAQKLAGLIYANRELIDFAYTGSFAWISEYVVPLAYEKTRNQLLSTLQRFSEVPPDVSMYDFPKGNWEMRLRQVEAEIKASGIWREFVITAPGSHVKLQYILKRMLLELWRDRRKAKENKP